MSDDSVIHWSKNHDLGWSDFLAEPNPAHEHDALSAIRFFVNPTIIADNPDKPKFFSISKITVTPEFQKNLSWVRQFVLNDPDSSSKFLKHEQGHFDLARDASHEIEQRAEKAFEGKMYPIRGKNEQEVLEYAREDAISLANEQVEKIKSSYFTALRDKYDKETEFGKNLKIQDRYNKRFEELK